MNTKQYACMGFKSVDSLFLGLTIPDDIEPVTINSLTLSWTLEALAEFELIKSSISDKNKNLPYASLRGLLQIAFDNLAYLDSSIGLSYTKITKENDIKAFAYLSEGENNLITKKIRPVLDEWISNYLQDYVTKNSGDIQSLNKLQDLWQENNLVKIKYIKSQVLPWKWSETGTTKGNHRYSYKDLVEYIARQIAGKEIFKNCGTMKRIISEHSTGGQAELMTNPISIKDKKGKFSLVFKLEIVTFPSIHQPVLRIDVSKRRWVYDLNEARYGLGNINGYIFSDKYNDRVFQYQLILEQNQDKKWIWNLDNSFETLARKLNLSATLTSGEEIALGQASTPENQVMLTFRYGLQKKYDISDGVPEIDKLEAYKAISQILESLGFIQFKDYQKVSVKPKHPSIDEEAGMINHITLLGVILESLENNDFSNFTPTYFTKLTTEERNSLLQKYFQISLDDIGQEKKGIEYNRKGKKLPIQIPKLQAIIKANNEALERLYPHESLQLIIFYEEHLQTDVNFVKNIAQITLGSRFHIQLQRLPKNIYGPKKTLPGNNLKAKERSQLRIEEWKEITEQLKNLNQRTFCLVLARKWCNNQLDDIINKPSTRQALASLAGSAVQFLLPIEKTKQGLLNLENYFHRVQASLKDLIAAHSGRIDGIQEKVNTYLKNMAPEKRPKEIIGVTIVRKQRGRVRGHVGQSYLLIATRLNVETGICELCCAYDKNINEDVKWYKFADGITFASQISPVKLASDKQTAKTYFAKFLNTVIEESVNNRNNPVVLIDSSNCVQLCPWLADVRITTNNITLNTQYQKMEVNWKGARIIRIRQDLAPGFIEEKVRQYAETSVEDNRTKKELTCDYTIPSATSPTNGLFKLIFKSETGCVTYLSMGKKLLHKESRGQSCYRETEIHKIIKDDNKQNMKNKADLEICEMTIKPVFIDKFPTPNPL